MKDWRQLSGLGLDTEDDEWIGHVYLENLLVGDYRDEGWTIRPGWLEVERVRDYLFHCEFDGSVERADGKEEDVEFKDDVPFQEVITYVPINAADPVAAAQAMARRLVGLTEFAGSRVTPYDAKRPSSLISQINTHHCVTLRTPWLQ